MYSDIIKYTNRDVNYISSNLHVKIFSLLIQQEFQKGLYGFDKFLI